ncbi:phage portal protein [Paenibacillus shunpengii]|uniref:Phage portal protein n=1 Tax=Paenibacillus shunpengii TaxID=2054424 RepID=A0ABW5SVX6_9BACL
MSEFAAFFVENIEEGSESEVAVSPRFKDKEGKPVLWKLRAISEELNGELRKECTRKVKQKGGVVTEIDQNLYIQKLAVETVVFPNLKDAQLQANHNVLGAEKLLGKLLLPGEFSKLIEEVNQINGFDLDINEEIEKVKN